MPDIVLCSLRAVKRPVSMFAEHPISCGTAPLNAAIGPRNGPPIVLFHGVVRRWRDFATVLPTLACRGYVIAVDHRGHGRSSRSSSYLIADFVADAVTVVRELPAPAVLVGHSLGALVALGVAATVPDAVRGIVLEDPPSPEFLGCISGTAYEVQWRAMRSLAGNHRSTRDIAVSLADVRLPGGARFGDTRDAAAIRFVASCLRDLDPGVLDPVLENQWFDGFDPAAAAAAVRCPALLLAADGREGGMLPGPDADALAGNLIDCSRVDLPGVGHLIHATKPEAFLRLVTNFIDSL